MKNRDNKGRFVKGIRSNPSTEFKKGQHWRIPKPYWSKNLLWNEYIEKGRSAQEIASDMGCTEGAILFWIHKHQITTRSMAEVRKIKKWCLTGNKNGMFGATGKYNPNWKGGVTPERQAFYSSLKWAKVVEKVWDRDKGVCKRCRKEANYGRYMHIHHIASFDLAKDLRCDPDNLVTVCSRCHAWIHSKANKDYEFLDKNYPRRHKSSMPDMTYLQLRQRETHR